MTMARELHRVKIAPKGMGLNDFVAMQEGFFAAEGLDVEFDWKTFRGTQSSWKDLQYFQRPQDRPYTEDKTDVIQGACVWGSICNASAGMGRFVAEAYGDSPWAIFVRPDSKIHRPQDLRNVPVAVGMRRDEAHRPEARQLRLGLAAHLRRAHLAEQRPPDQPAERQEAPIGAEQTRHLAGGRHAGAGGDVEVEADAELGAEGVNAPHGVVDARRVHQKRRRGDDAGPDRLLDAVVDQRRQAEIVGVDDQLAHARAGVAHGDGAGAIIRQRRAMAPDPAAAADPPAPPTASEAARADRAGSPPRRPAVGSR